MHTTNPFTADSVKANPPFSPFSIFDVKLHKNGGLDQYGDGPFKQQQFGTAGVEGVNVLACCCVIKLFVGCN